MTKWVTTRPDDYVKWQFEYNALHSDNTRECYIEEGQVTAKWLVQRIHTEGKPSSILDVGCRTGYVMDTFQQAFPAARVVGVDIVPEFVEAASQVGDAMVADAHDLPFKDREFDYVFCAQTLEHCYDVPKALGEMFRVAYKGVLVAIPLEDKQSFDANPSHMVSAETTLRWLDVFKPWDATWQLLYVFPTQGGHYMTFYLENRLWE